MAEKIQSAERSWENLPGEILNNISRRITSMIDFSCFRSVCNPWRTKVTVTNIPHFIEVDRNDEISCGGRLADPSWFTFRPQNNREHLLGSYNGWLILTSVNPWTCWLYNPVTQSRIDLPPWFAGSDRVFFSSPPTSSACIALLIGRSQRQFRFCKPGAQWWQQGTDGYPFSSSISNDYLCDAVAVDGQFYALSDQGYWTTSIDCFSQHQPIAVSLRRVVLSWPGSWPKKKIFHRYMVESGGKVLVVFLLASVHTGHIDEVQVFRLNYPNWAWERVYELDGRILFVGLDSSFSIARTDEWDEEGDVYFREKGYFLFKSYNLKNNTMKGRDHRTDLRIQKRGGWLLASFERI